MLSNVSAYTSAWNTINTAANTASSSVTALATYCASQAAAAQNLLNGADADNYNAPGILNPFISASNAQASAVPTVLANEIAPVLAQAQAVPNTVSATQTLAIQVQAEAAVVPIANPTQFSTDVSTLSTMSPTALDVANAQLSASVTGEATASPTGSLTVSGGTLVDQMNLITTNANALQASCNIPTVPDTFSYY